MEGQMVVAQKAVSHMDILAVGDLGAIANENKTQNASTLADSVGWCEGPWNKCGHRSCD